MHKFLTLIKVPLKIQSSSLKSYKFSIKYIAKSSTFPAHENQNRSQVTSSEAFINQSESSIDRGMCAKFGYYV